VFLCIVVGITLGHFFSGTFHWVGALEVAEVNLPVAVLVWLMIIPMLLKVDLRALKGVRRHWRGVGVTLFVNWAVKPFSMAALNRPPVAQRGTQAGRCCAARTVLPGRCSTARGPLATESL